MKFFFLTLILFSSTLPAAENFCNEEKTRFCSGMKTPIEETQCLIDHKDDLSTECRQELQRLNQLVKDSGFRSGGISSFGGVVGGLGLIPPKKTIISAEGMSAFQGNPVVINQGKVSLTTPVWTSGEKTFTSTVSAGTVKINERVLTPDNDKVGELHRMELSGQYARMTETNGMTGLRVALGSAGDKPFHSARELIFSVNAFYAPPGEVKDSHWIYTLSFFNNNGFANYIPIPGFIYLYKNETFTGMFGLPFLNFQWTPVKPWLISFSWFITNLKSSVSYVFSDTTQMSLGFSINQQTFLREGRDELRDRLFLNDKRIYLGLRHAFSKDLSLELQSGSSFDRSLREGRRFNDTEWRRDLGRSWYASAAVNYSF